MANYIEHAQVMQTELDKAAVAQSTSGWMELNDKLVKYTGGDEVKIPEIDTDGLGDYDRQKGFPQGSVSFKWKTYGMTQDRGQLFTFDEHEVDETNFLLTAPTVMGEFQREHVVPEIDAYRYSKIGAGAIAQGQVTGGYDPAEATILKKLYDDLTAVQDIAGESTPLVIIMAMPVAAILSNSEKLGRKLDVTDFAQGDVTLKIKSLDGLYPIIRVPSARMKTAYEFFDGREDGDNKFGFAPAADAKSMNWIITPRNAPIAVSKTDSIRIFDPATLQGKRAWQADYRKFHELWVPNKKWKTIRVCTKEA